MSASVTSQRFAYRAMSAGAGVSLGEVEATTPERAREELRRQGLVVVELRPMQGRLRGVGRRAAVLGDGARASERASTSSAWRRARAGVFGELSLLLGSGMALDAALESVVGIARKREHREALETLARSVREGRTLAEGVRELRAWFPPVHAAMLQVGEESGTLPEALLKLNEQEERTARMRQQVASALTYPVILLGAGTLMLAGIVGFVVPRFAVIFDDMEVQPPWFSRVVIELCLSIGKWGPVGLALLVAGMIWFRWHIADEQRRAGLERWVLTRTPLGTMWWKHQSAGFCGSMGMMLGAGTPLLRALEIGSTAWTSVELRRRLDAVVGRVRDGGRLSEAIRTTGLLPDRLEKLVAVGEDSGTLGRVFERLGESLEHEVGSRTKRALTLLEPAAILAIGLVVGAVVVAMLLAIFSINNLQTV